MGQPVVPEVDESTTVVVTPPADTPAPVYVTAGELDARLQEQETRLGVQIESAVSAAFAAQVAADEAALEAAAAAGTAEAAIEVAVEAAETAEEATTEPAPADDEEEGPRAPQPRAETPASDETSDAPPAKKKRTGYGAGWVYGKG